MTRIALVWNALVPIVDTTVRYELFVQGLQSLGCEAITICLDGCQDGYPHAVHTVASAGELASRAFWREIACDAGVMINWHRMTDVLLSMRAVGMSTLSLADSDGQVSVRYHPWPTLRFMAMLQPTLRGKLGAAKYWLSRYLLNADTEHKDLLENLSASDVLTFAGEGAATEFRRLLSSIGGAHLASRLAWLPYPVPTSFCSMEVCVQRPNRIIAVGRWDSPQKNPRLLAAALRRLAATDDRPEVLILGKGSESHFASLRQVYPEVRLLGLQPRERVRELMATCRSLIISSRWEGCPVAANEMLALGGTIVFTPLPGLAAIGDCDSFGRCSGGHKAHQLYDAIVVELDAWKKGERNSARIATYWRQRVSPEAVAARMLNLLTCRTVATTA